MLSAVDLSHVVWRKSSRSTAESQCVEVGYDSEAVGVRDSKNAAGPALIFPANRWTAFLHDIRTGRFDA